ncbi:restriction endonuclease subunit S [Pasteurellaceae bacterium 15-036681]|nr:restriction endonuclease subunit S [Pasteurellaceae bacterium 15-036681]
MDYLDNYLNFSNGKTSPSRNIDGKYKVFGSNGIIGSSDECNSKARTIVIGRVGAYCGSVHFSEEECWITDNAISVSCKNEGEEYFWYYLLKSLDLNNFRTGSGQPLLNQSILKSISINVPSEHIIRANIGVSLSIFDQKIELNTQINQTLEQIAQTIFKSWFIDFDPVTAKAEAIAQGKTAQQANFSAMAVISGKTFEELDRLQAEKPTEYQQLWELAEAFPSGFEGDIPKGWKIAKIEDVIKKIPVGKKYSSKTVSSEGLVPVLDQGRSGLIGYHNDKAGVQASIEEPVIVFANHTCYMRLITYDFSAIQNVFAFIGKETNVLWTYLATIGKQEFTEYKGHFPDFLIKEIIVPNKELTELLGKRVKPLFDKIAVNELENKSLAETRDLLLPKLLSGEL